MHEIDPVISVVDDDTSVRSSLRRLLKAMGFEVRTFASAVEYLQQGPIHDHGCVIVDVRMPGMNGIDLQKKLQETRISPPIIFMTAYEDPGVREQAMQAGAVAFLQKPLVDSSLTDSIALALERSRQRISRSSTTAEKKA